MSKRSGFIPIMMLTALLAGCDTPHYYDLDGSWTYTATNLSGADSLGDAASCSATGLMALSGSEHQDIAGFLGPIEATVFTGTYSNLTVVCMVNGVQHTRGPLQGAVVEGEVYAITSNGQFFFESDSVVTAWYNANATVSAGAMKSGAARATIDFGPPLGPVSVDGSFSAAKQK